MQTCPSIDDVAICIELDGVAGIVRWFDFGDAGRFPALVPDLLGVPCSSAVVSAGASGLDVGKGRGKGDTETDVIDAECAR